MSNETNLPLRTGSFRAAVQVGETATEYYRSGSGRPVVILKHAAAPGDWAALTDGLARQFRVIAPMVATRQDDFSLWFRSFLDGLGLARIRIIADDAFAAPAIGFAVLETDRVERLVVLSSSAPAAEGPIVEAGRPILIVRDDLPAAEILATLVRFLAVQDGAGPAR